MSSAPKINQIPSELLALIFATGLRGLSYDAHRPLLALICSVCRHWRDVAIEASELWTTIHIPLDLHLPATLAFLERSKGRLIDVYIRAADIDRDRFTYSCARAAATITAITAPHIPRVRTLVVVLTDPDLYTIFSDAYCSISAPNLISLSIHLDDCFWKPGAYPPRFVANSNSLCRFVTQGNLLNVVPSRMSLTTLELSKYFPTHVELQDLFNSSLYLETLILHDFDRNELGQPIEHDAAPIIITAPTTLKSLAVSLYWHTYNKNRATSCSCILGSLHTPNLEYLEVVGFMDVQIDLRVHFGPLDKLRTLRLQRCSISSAVEEFSLSLKELRRLELVDMSPEDMRYIVDPPPSFPFPRLSSVFFSTTEGNTGRDFPYRLLQFAERCIAAGCPHFTLEVEERHYGEFFNAFESRIQDGRVCIIKNDCGGLIIDETESEEMPGWEDDDSDRWGDGEAWPEDEDEVEDDGWDDPGWEDGEGYLSDEWPEIELEDTDSDNAF